MVKKSKMDEIYNDVKKVEPVVMEWTKVEKEKMVHANFYIRADELEKLKQYVDQVSPRHIKISLSMFIRYLIESCDIEKAKKEFFKL